MHSVAKGWLVVCIALSCCCGGAVAHADWSLEWTQNYYSPEVGANPVAPFTKMELFILPVTAGVPVGITFAEATSISSSSTQWQSQLPNSKYSVLTETNGSPAGNANITTFFSGPKTAKFDLDLLLWNGSTGVQQEEFVWNGSALANPLGTPIAFDPNSPRYDRNSISASPVPPSILLMAVGLSGLFIRRRISHV